MNSDLQITVYVFVISCVLGTYSVFSSSLLDEGRAILNGVFKPGKVLATYLMSLVS